MNCEKCNERPATVHVTKIVNGQKYETHLCSQCAQREQEAGFNFQPSLAIPDFLAALFNLGPQMETELKPTEPTVCPKCGLNFEQITKLGRLGCNECYNVFDDKLEPLLRRIHGSGQHIGKVPLRSGGTIRQKKEINRLRALMQQLITKEEFEEAATVRDKIRALEQGLEG